MRTNRTTLLGSMLATMAVCHSAHASVIVNVIPDDQVVNLGDQFEISIYADMTEPILGWGMIFSIADPDVCSLKPPPVTGPDWFDTSHPADVADDWFLGGLAFPDPVMGDGILLATLTLTADSLGETDLVLTIDPGNLRQGFALGPPFPVGSFDDFVINNGHVEVVPAPGAMVIVLGVFGIRRRRRE